MRRLLMPLCFLTAVVLTLAATGCRASDQELANGADAADLDPCGGSDHPCTMADVTPEAHARTKELTDLVMERLDLDQELDPVAAWLREQEGVVSVATGEEAVRFRVRGGRGHWIFAQSLGTVALLSAASIPSPPREAAFTAGTDATMASGSPSLDPPASAAWQGTTKGKEKRALLLSPFRWQWEITGATDGLDEVAAALRARDYSGRVDLWTERLDPDNPDCASAATRWDDCRTTGEIGLDAFTIWGQYDYVHLVTHGGAVKEGNRYLTAVMTPWTVDLLKGARSGIEAGGSREDLLELIDAIGVETASVHGIALTVAPDAVPQVGPGQRRWTHVSLSTIETAEGLAFARDEGVPLHPGLTPTERTQCSRALEAIPDSERVRNGRDRAETSGGKPCGLYDQGTGTGMFVMLSSRFFKWAYPEGVDDAVIVLSACSSGVDDDLLQAVNGRNTAVIGWKKSVSIDAAAAAGKLIASRLVEVDESVEKDSGFTVGQAMEKVRELIDEATADAPSEAECNAPANPDIAARCALQVGQVLSVINDRPADAVTGAMITVLGDTAIRAREIVYLLDDDDEELKDGSTLRAIGTAGDGRADSVDLKIRVDGLGLEEDPQAVGLQLVFEGREIHVDGELDEEVAPGVWELAYRLPLGRDHEAGERVDLEVVAVLTEVGDSRWSYEDIELTSANCHWEADQTGPTPRHLSGSTVRFVSGRASNALQLAGEGSESGEWPDPNIPTGLTFPFAGEPRVGLFQPADESMITLWGTTVPLSYSKEGNVRLTTVIPNLQGGGFAMIAGEFTADFDGVVVYPEVEGPITTALGATRVHGTFLWTPGCPSDPGGRSFQWRGTN